MRRAAGHPSSSTRELENSYTCHSAKPSQPSIQTDTRLFQSIQVIAFDLDDTLWPCMPTIERAERQTYRWMQQHYPRITEKYSEQDLLDLRRQFMQRDEKYTIDLSLMRKHWLAELAEESGYPADSLSRQGFELFHRLRHEVEIYPDVFPVLNQLRPQYRLGSISNGNAMADRTALKEYFEGFINAADVMVRKPGAEIFEAFCRQFQVKPEHCLYIGDDAELDVDGARRVGMTAVWVNRNQQSWPTHLAPPDLQIDNLYPLLEVLQNQQPSQTSTREGG